MTSLTSGYSFNKRRGQAAGEIMSVQGYVLFISALLVGGLALAAYIASITYNMVPTGWWFLGYFAMAIPGVLLSIYCGWELSLLGYALVIVPTGAIIGPYVHHYSPATVMQAVVMTGGATAALGIGGALYPKSVESWGGILFMGLSLVILGDLARIIVMSFGLQPTTLRLVDWIAVIVFCGYIFYDMNRAMKMDRTLDNAVDSVVALYLDVINLFLRILSIMGSDDD